MDNIINKLSEIARTRRISNARISKIDKPDEIIETIEEAIERFERILQYVWKQDTIMWQEADEIEFIISGNEEPRRW